MSGETPIIRDILDALEQLGVEAFRAQSGRVRVRGGWMVLCPEGTADILGYLPPAATMFGVECKTPGGRHPLTDEQQAWGERLVRAGGLYVVARTVGEALAGLGLAQPGRAS